MDNTTTNSDCKIPKDLLQLSHSFGFDFNRRENLQLLDEDTLAFVAGNVVVLLNINTKQQRYIPSSSGKGIGAIMPHPSKKYFAVAEKGDHPDIIIYKYPSLEPHRKLRGGTEKTYSYVSFNPDGTLLASVGGAPDYMLTVWDWDQEKVVLRYKAFSQDVYRVTFSPHFPTRLISSGSGHIRFWEMADSFSGLKLLGVLGKFGSTPMTDIEGFVELPDGKVVSGSEWGNMLLWDEGLIKVEIRRKYGRPCHAGPIRQIVLEEGHLISVGADGVIRCWDLESIESADCMDDSGLFEVEPIGKLFINRSVSFSSIVKSTIPDSTIWFAQDSSGRIWKLDLSFSLQSLEPVCLFSFHSGSIEGMDVSGSSHLMATTALDCSVRVFDFLSKKEIAVSHFRQGGSTLTWAPPTVCGGEGLVVVGFDDGVVRLLALHKPQSLHETDTDSLSELHLKQAIKPHDTSVTAIAFSHDGKIMASGGLDGRVFFSSVGDRLDPIGFVTVPGPVQGLQWTPQSHGRNALLVVCERDYVVEIEAPDIHAPTTKDSYQLENIPMKYFCFSSIESHMKTEEDIQETNDQEQAPVEDSSPSYRLHCAFYSAEPGEFWLSVGGYGFLCHCKFSEDQSIDFSKRRDEPFAYVPIQDAENNSILTVCFCESRQLLLCGMQDGSIRAYPVQSGELQPGHMQEYWSLGVHDSQYGSVRQLRLSHDGRFVLSTGADGTIFSFKMLEMEDMEKKPLNEYAKVPPPGPSLDTARDIDDPTAYSLETAKQKLQSDRLRQEAESRKQECRRTIAELRKRFKELVQRSQSLPEHMRLQQSELEVDPRFREEIERRTAEKVQEVKRELAWESEKIRIGLQKLQDRFVKPVVCDTVIVCGIQSDLKVSNYKLEAPKRKHHLVIEQEETVQNSTSTSQRSPEEQKDTPADVTTVQNAAEKASRFQQRVPMTRGDKLAAKQEEKMRKDAEKVQNVRAKIEQRKREWKELLAAKPSKDYEDPEDIRAIQLAEENLGDFKLKTAEDYVVPEHKRMNVAKKIAQIDELDKHIYQKKSQMNAQVFALRDSKLALISQCDSLMRQLLAVQKLLPPEKHRPLPTTPTLKPEELPDRNLEYSPAVLERYAATRAKLRQMGVPEESMDVLEMMEQDAFKDTGKEEGHTEETRIDTKEQGVHTVEEGVHTEEERVQAMEILRELDPETIEMDESRLLYLQDKLIKQMEDAVHAFDAQLRLLRCEKSEVDVQLKMAELRHNIFLQELMVLKEFEQREIIPLERQKACMQEYREVMSKLEECKNTLTMKNRDIEKLQERQKTLMSTFQNLLGEENKFADFLTKVFKKKIKRVKKKEPGDDDEEEDSEEDSDEESELNSDEDDDDETGLDYNVCPPNCDPELFENVIALREHRLDLEELLHEEKNKADNLKTECDLLMRKEKIVQKKLKAVEDEVELLYREKHQKLIDLDVVVPLTLHQIKNAKSTMPFDISKCLVIDTASVNRLHERIKELRQEHRAQKQKCQQERQQHVQLQNKIREMKAERQKLKTYCEEEMIKKFGKIVDLTTLQTLTSSPKLEKIKYEREVRKAQMSKELTMWQDKVAAARQELAGVTEEHTERMRKLKRLLDEKQELEDKFSARQKKMTQPFHDYEEPVQDDIQRLQVHVKKQAEEIKRLKQEISTLSRKDVHVLPQSKPRLPSTHRSKAPSSTLTGRRGHVRPSDMPSLPPIHISKALQKKPEQLKHLKEEISTLSARRGHVKASTVPSLSPIQRSKSHKNQLGQISHLKQDISTLSSRGINIQPPSEPRRPPIHINETPRNKSKLTSLKKNINILPSRGVRVPQPSEPHLPPILVSRAPQNKSKITSLKKNINILPSRGVRVPQPSEPHLPPILISRAPQTTKKNISKAKK